jgi:hypothetical protein
VGIEKVSPQTDAFTRALINNKIHGQKRRAGTDQAIVIPRKRPAAVVVDVDKLKDNFQSVLDLRQTKAVKTAVTELMK